MRVTVYNSSEKLIIEDTIENDYNAFIKWKIEHLLNDSDRIVLSNN